MAIYLLKIKAGGNLHLQTHERGGGYLFRPQLLSLIFYVLYTLIIDKYYRNYNTSKKNYSLVWD